MESKIIPSDAVRAIQESVETKVIEVDGTQFVTRQIHNPPASPMPATLKVHTLTGLIEFLTRSDRPQIDLIHIEDEGTVHIYGPIQNRELQRPRYALAEVFSGKSFPFDRFIDQESFTINVQSCFVPNDERARLLSFTGNLLAESINNQSDDGVSQSAVKKTGVSLAGKPEKAPNPINLCPYRTFPEVEQPASDFILRLKKNGEEVVVGLFETADLKWKLEAIQSIQAYLAGKIKDVTILA